MTEFHLTEKDLPDAYGKEVMSEDEGILIWIPEGITKTELRQQILKNQEVVERLEEKIKNANDIVHKYENIPHVDTFRLNLLKKELEKIKKGDDDN